MATMKDAPMSRPFAVSELRERKEEMILRASPLELAALARFNGLPGVAELEARFSFERRGRRGLAVKGGLRARFTQTCVVTLDPFEGEMDEALSVVFEPPARAATPAGEAEPPIDLALDEDPPEAIISGKVDLGALAAEYFTLGLDPYPRKPGAALAPGPDAAPPLDRPFANLKNVLAMKGNKK